MPVWLSVIVWKILLPDLIVWLRNRGYFNVAEELAAKGALAVYREIKDLKTFPEYPKEKDRFGSN